MDVYDKWFHKKYIYTYIYIYIYIIYIHIIYILGKCMDINQRSPIRDWGPNSSVYSVGTILPGRHGSKFQRRPGEVPQDDGCFSEEATDSMRQIWKYGNLLMEIYGNI